MNPTTSDQPLYNPAPRPYGIPMPNWPQYPYYQQQPQQQYDYNDNVPMQV